MGEEARVFWSEAALVAMCMSRAVVQREVEAMVGERAESVVWSSLLRGRGGTEAGPPRWVVERPRVASREAPGEGGEGR